MKKSIVLVFLFITIHGVSQEDLSYGKEFHLDSKILGESRTYWVHLPASYNDPSFGKERYPVIYVLDGKSTFFPLVGVVNFMGGGESVNYQIPEAIVVGIDTKNRIKDLTPNASTKNPEGQEATTESGKAMFQGSGGGELFLQFLTEELFPHIESDFRTLSYRVYVGHSLGGLTSTYTLLKHPGIFNGYITIDPSLWWDNAKHVKEASEQLQNFGTEKIQRFYLSVIDSSGRASKSLHVKSIFSLQDKLKQHAPDNLGWKVEMIPDTDHSSIPLLSWYNGLRFIFKGYDMDHYAMMQNPDLIDAHFQDLAKNIGLDMAPPQSIFDIVTHYLTAANRFPNAEKAVYAASIAVHHHPKSPLLLERLGKAHEMNNNKVDALEVYRKALEYGPKNKALEEKVRQLEKQE